MEINNPFEIFKQWFDKACSHEGINQPNAMNIATVDKNGFPSNRIVLLKDFDENGFVFYTNLESKKGNAIKENPNVSLCFYWEKLNRQIRIEGKAFAVSDEDADKYFDSRPLKSRLGAWISKQSRPMESGIDLFKNTLNYGAKMGIKKITRPPFWSGFRVRAKNIEFWQDGNSRLHDRFLFFRDDYDSNNWKKTRLYP
jgi:pyridoxamine 5'-phosphate oxidase